MTESAMSTESSEMLLVIDTDCGLDDAMAILLALSFREKCRILAITCCQGNTTIQNSTNNVLKIFNTYGHKYIPVYSGCVNPLLRGCEEYEEVHGSDGLGNLSGSLSAGDLKVEEEHAVNALIRLARHHRNEINVVALAPLTNLAVAHRIDPQFMSNLKSLTIMGGNYKGLGNVTPAAEFNFLQDPEAAHMVLSEASCPVTLVPWESTLDHPLSWDFYEKLVSGASNILKEMMKFLSIYCKLDGNAGLVTCDFMAMAALLYPEVIGEIECCPVSVETEGRFTRGQCVVHRLKLPVTKSNSVKIITAFNDDRVNDLYVKLLNFGNKS